MVLQIFEMHNSKGFGMGGFEVDRGRHPNLKGFLPAGSTETPAIAGFEARKMVLGHGGTQIVTLVFGKFQESWRHLRTDHMAAKIVRASGTAAIPIKAS